MSETSETIAPGTPENTYGGQVIGRTLKACGVEHVFGVHGVINLAIEESNRQGIGMIHFRHEQSAGFAADAYARCLRKPGVCFSSTAPGFTNLVSPIAQAAGALSPVVLLNGQHGISGDGMSTIQEGYATEVMKPFAKWTHRSLDWNQNAHWTARALTEAMQWPPGPVVLEFPRNSLNAKGPDRQQKVTPTDQRAIAPGSLGDPAAIEKAVQMLIEAERPLIIAGDGVYWSQGEAALRELVELLQVPVQTRRTARGAVPETHPLAVSGGYRGEFIRNADLIVILGHRATWLDEWFEAPDWPDTKYIQIQPADRDLWLGLPTKVAIVGSTGPVLRQMIACTHMMLKAPPIARTQWVGRVAEARKAFKDKQAERVAAVRGSALIHPHSLGAAIAEILDPSATIIYDSFTATSFLTDKLEAKFAGQILDAGLHQPVGHGVGMAVGAQVARPGKQVLTLMGDGGFGISAMDVETLVRYKLPAVVVVFNNSSWSGVAAGHDQFYPDMESWDNLPGIRYDRMFAELGCHTEHVDAADQLLPALERSFNSGKPALLNVVGDTDQVHPLRVRVGFGDTWTRDNFDSLPESGRAELKRNGAPATLARIQKFWRDNGVDIPMSDLEWLAQH
jgi:acetolactate synthase-1/2/3 large subunit